MLANLGQYGLYLIMMISIINTVEYNELKHGTRDEAIITSMRPFLTKMASSFTVMITSASYIICRVQSYTKQIKEFEEQAEILSGNTTVEEELKQIAADKASQIADVVASVSGGQKIGLLMAMTLIPCCFMLISVLLYRKFYKIDEKRYEEICAEIKAKA